MVLALGLVLSVCVSVICVNLHTPHCILQPHCAKQQLRTLEYATDPALAKDGYAIAAGI